MRQSQTLALAAGALVLVLGWWFLADAEPSEAAAPAPLERVDAAQADAALDRPRDATARANGDELHSARLATALRASSPPEDSAPAPSRGVELIAVRGAARKRVDGAAMWWWPEGERSKPPDGSKFEDLYFEGRLDAAFAQHAEALLHDELGRFFAPGEDAALRTGFVVASAPGLWGYTFVHRAEPSPCFVVLEVDADIEVRVVDPSGGPVSGARVALRSFFRAGEAADHVRAYTDTSGRALLRHVIRAVGFNESFSDELRVSIADPLASDVGVPIDLANLPESPIELVMPQTGAVEVVFEDGGTTDGSSGVWVALRVVSCDTPDDEAVPRAVPTPRQVERGSVRFPFVPVGYDVVASTRRAECGWRLEYVRGRGPARVGETARVEFRSEAPSTTLRGRLLNSDGGPVSDLEFEYTIDAAESYDAPALARVGLRTDLEGRFVTRAGIELADRMQFGVVVRDSLGRPAERADVPLPDGERTGTIELGDLVLAPMPLLAAGIVIDSAGQPVPFAAIEVHEPIRSGAPDEVGAVDWSPRWRVETKSDASGRFRVVGDSETPTVALWPKRGEQRGEPTEVRVGDEQVVLTLAWDGAIAGQVLLPQSVARQHVTLNAVERDAAPDAIRLQEWRPQMLDDSNEFVIRGLAAGGYDLLVLADGADEPIGRVENVRVSPGLTTRDARLDPLDLRESVEFANLRVLGPDGQPIPFGDALWANGRDDEGFSSNSFFNGRLRLSRALTAPTVWIGADGYLLAAVDPATVGDEVRLRPAQRVRVEFTGGVALPEPPIEFSVTLRARGEPDWLQDIFNDSFDFEGERSATGQVRRLGALDATLWLYGEEWSECAATIVDGAVLGESPNVPTIALSVDPQTLAAAVAKARAGDK